MTSLVRRLATALCRPRNVWWPVSTEERRLRTAMTWAHYHLAEDSSEASALWVMYFLDRALRRGADLDTASVVARGLVDLWEHHKGAESCRAVAPVITPNRGADAGIFCKD